MCSVLCRSSAWMRGPELGIDWRRVIHAEESFIIRRRIAPKGRMRGSFEVTSIEDKGPSKGALLHLKRELHDADDGGLVAVTESALVLQGDGGRRGFGTPPPPFNTVTPKLAPDRIETLRISPRGADLSIEWRHESTACRSGCRTPRRIRSTGFARALYQWYGVPRNPFRVLRAQPRDAQSNVGALYQARVPR